MKLGLLRTLAVLLLFVPLACSPHAYVPDRTLATGNAAVQAPLPPLLLTTPHTVLWMSTPGAGRPPTRLASTGARLRLEVRDPVVRGGYVQVLLKGGMAVEGYARVQDLGVCACVAGPLGANGYVGAGNLVRLGGALHAGSVAIADQALVRVRPWVEGKPWGHEYARIPVVGDLSREHVCAALPPRRHAGTDADPLIGDALGEPDLEDFPKDAVYVDIPAGVTLTLRDRPDGAPLLTREAEPYGFVLVRMSQQHTATGDWDHVAVGGGPYVLGWMPSRPAQAPMEGGMGILGALVGGVLGSKDAVPFSLATKHLQRFPLRVLPASSAIQQFGQVFATLSRDGWARAGDVRDGWQYVWVAVDNDVLVEGWVRPEALREAPGHPSAP